MKQFKITYWNEKLGFKNVIIEAETEEEAINQFMDITINANYLAYCKTEEISENSY